MSLTCQCESRCWSQKVFLFLEVFCDVWCKTCFSKDARIPVGIQTIPRADTAFSPFKVSTPALGGSFFFAITKQCEDLGIQCMYIDIFIYLLTYGILQRYMSMYFIYVYFCIFISISIMIDMC